MARAINLGQMQREYLMPDKCGTASGEYSHAEMPLRCAERAKRPKVCFVSTIAWSLKFHIAPHIRKISESCQVTLVANEISSAARGVFDPAVVLKNILIERKIDLFADIVTVFRLWRFFRREHFDCVHSIAPKAGLLAMLAAKAAGVPIRFHTFTGQVWVTRKGMSRRFLMMMDWLIARFATHVLTDSLSQQEFLIENKIVGPEKVGTLALGSIAGIDTVRFAPDGAAKEKIRSELGIGHSDIVFLFIARLNRDKGVSDLLRAFEEISVQHPEMHLLLVGPDEENYDEYFATLNKALQGKIHRVGFTPHPERYMAAADVFCLPSYREGFNNVVLESAAVCVPAVASRINGITDPVVDGVTGILHEPGNIAEIVRAMLALALDQPLRLKMGDAARTRVIQIFSQERLTNAFAMFYRNHGVLCEND